MSAALRHGRGAGQVEGERHPAAKLGVEVVALARLIAADAALARGWVLELAIANRVSDSTVIMAIGGKTWKCITSPPPVAARKRHAWGANRPGNTLPRRRCPACGGYRYAAKERGCRNRFHLIDHRAFTSPTNARHARAGAR